MKIIMNLINLFRIILLLGSIILIAVSWEYRNFALLLLLMVLITLLFATFFPKLKYLTVPTIATLLILVISELAIPFFLPNHQELTEYDKSTSYAAGGYFDRIANFGYRLSSGVHTSRKLTSAGEIIYDVIYTIGKDGYRKDLKDKKFDGYIYGGSFTFGEGLNDNETLSFYLKEKYGIKTKNLGVHGFGLHQALYNIEQGITSYDGFNILLTAPWHASRSACKKSYTIGTPLYKVEDNNLKHVGFCSGGDTISRVLSKSNIFSLFKQALINTDNSISDSDIDLYLAIIRRIKEISNKNNSSLIIAYIDSTEERLVNTKWTNESIIAEMSDISYVVDVTLAERIEELDPKFYIHELDEHPSSIANQERAMILYHMLQKINSE